MGVCDDLAALRAARNQGVTKVKYADKEIEYMNLGQMNALIARLEIECNGPDPDTAKYGRRYAEFKPGT